MSEPRSVPCASWSTMSASNTCASDATSVLLPAAFVVSNHDVNLWVHKTQRYFYFRNIQILGINKDDIYITYKYIAKIGEVGFLYVVSD